RERFRAQLSLAELFMNAAGDVDVLPLVTHLGQECRTRQLASWEPTLALQAWQLILRAARQTLASPLLADDEPRRQACLQAQYDAMRELAAIDPITATKSH